MSTNYPGALDSFVNPTATDTLDSATVPHAAQHDNINDAMSAVQVTLGVNPQGGSATVVARLTALDSTVAGKASLSAANTFTTGTQVIATGADGTVGLKVKRNSATQSADIVQVTQSDGTTILAKIDSAGAVTAPNITDTALSTAGIVTNTSAGLLGTVASVPVANGGTGATTLTSGNALIGNGTGAVTSTAVATDGAANTIVKSGSVGNITATQSITVKAGISSGVVSLAGLTSGNAVIQAPAVASGTQILPTTGGTLVSTGMVSGNAQVTSGMIVNDTIVNADINASAAIADTKLDTIATAGKVSNSATTATSSNTASAIVARDSSGNFTAGTVSASVNAGSGGSVTTQTLNVNAGSTPTAVFKGAASSFSTTVQAQSSLAAANTATLPSSTGTILTDADTIATTQLTRTGSGTNVVTDTSPTITTATLTTPVVTNLKTANEIYKFQSAPTTVAATGNAAITAAGLLSGLVTSAPATAQTNALPTGSSLQTAWAISYSPAGYSVEWSFINTGTANATITTSSGSTNTMVSGNNAVVAAGTSGRFLTKNTANNTFLTYRLA
jgi:hypothetical protein